MKNIKIMLLMLSTALMMSCGSDDDSGFTIVANIEGTDVTFKCNRNSYANGDEYSIGCQHGFDARLNFHKGFDENGGILKVTYTDVPNTEFFDSGYGIHYSCDTNPVTTLYEPYCTGNQPTFDSATSTLTLNGVTLTAGNNNTDIIESFPGEELEIVGDGVYVAGRETTTISATIVLDDVPYFQ